MDAEHSIALPGSAAGNARSVTVVGGGLGGLVAAIRRAEQGVPAVLHEANRRLGGRAGSTGTAVHRQPRSARPVRRRHHLALPARAPHSGTDGTAAGGRRPVPLPGEAPADAAVVRGVAAVFTYHHDPGELSASFVAERFARVFALPPAVRYVRSGWATLVAAHAGTHRDGQPGRRGWGVFSLAAAVVTVLLVAVMCWLFNPRSPAAPTHLGGLAERAVSVATLAWWVILGWRLFRAGLPASAERGYHPGPGAAVRPT